MRVGGLSTSGFELLKKKIGYSSKVRWHLVQSKIGVFSVTDPPSLTLNCSNVLGQMPKESGELSLYGVQVIVEVSEISPFSRERRVNIGQHT
jgi:hypothetical protein